jgi:hypothetical protein
MMSVDFITKFKEKFMETYWKFTTFDAFSFLLENNAFKITPPMELNDSGEFKASLSIKYTKEDFWEEFEDIFSIHKEYFEKIIGRDISDSKNINLEERDKIWKSCERDIEILKNNLNFPKIFSNYGIFSFTEADQGNNTSTLWNQALWSHYGDAHKGVAYSFNEEYLDTKVRKVIYDLSTPQLKISFKKIKVNKKGEPVFYINEDDFLIIASHKHKIWKYENEKRCIYNLNNLEIKYDISKKIFIKKFTKLWSGSVVLGHKVSESDINFLRIICEKKKKNNPEWAGIDIIRSINVSNNYQLSFTSL